MAKHPPGRALSLNIEPRQRLVEEQQSGLQDQSPRQRDALSLTTGELVGPALREARDGQAFERFADPRAYRTTPQPLGAQAEGHVLEGGEMRKERRVLSDVADVPLPGRHHGARAAAPVDLFIQHDLARIRALEPGEDAQQGGFPRPVLPHHHQSGGAVHR